MDAMPSPKKSSLFRWAEPAAVLGLTALVLGYALMSRAEDAQPQKFALVPADEVIAVAPTPNSETAPRARFGLAHAPAAGRAMPLRGDAAARLAQLHAQLGKPADAEAKRDQLVAQMESQHLAERVDAAWSAQSEERIVAATSTDVMSRAGFAPKNLATDCRSQTCRISAQFSSAIDAKSWAERLLTQMGNTIGQARVAILPQGDGNYEVRVYGGRKA
jgi:hypothetical protein